MILQQFVRLETPKHLKNLFLFPWLNRADFFKKCDLFSQKLCMTSYLRLQNDDMVRFPLVAKRDSGKSRTNPLLEQPRVFQSQQSGNPNAEIYLQMARPCKCFTCIYYKTKKPCHHRKHPPKPKTHPPNYLKKNLVDSKLRAALGTVVVVLAAKARSISTTSGVGYNGDKMAWIKCIQQFCWEWTLSNVFLADIWWFPTIFVCKDLESSNWNNHEKLVAKIQCLFHVFFYPLSIVQSVSNKRNLIEDSVWNTSLLVEAHVENLSLFQGRLFWTRRSKGNSSGFCDKL